MNASYPVQRAILMDVVSKNARGKWNSLEGLTSFTWTGSAVLGGYLIDQHGYGFTFFITGAIYIAATMILSLLIPLTWGEKIEEKKEITTVHKESTDSLPSEEKE
jgi:MFS family permease